MKTDIEEPTRLELFCQFVEEIQTKQQKEKQELEFDTNFFSLLDSNVKSIKAEFTKILSSIPFISSSVKSKTSSSAASSSTSETKQSAHHHHHNVLESYSTLLFEAISILAELVVKEFTSKYLCCESGGGGNSTTRTTFSQLIEKLQERKNNNQETEEEENSGFLRMIKSFRTLASVLSLAERYGSSGRLQTKRSSKKKTSSSSSTTTSDSSSSTTISSNYIFDLTQKILVYYSQYQQSLAPIFTKNEIYTTTTIQSAKCSCETISENFRVPCEIFDPREAPTSVSNILTHHQSFTDHHSNNQNQNQNQSEKNQQETEEETLDKFHIKCLAPLVISSTSPLVKQLEMLFELIIQPEEISSSSSSPASTSSLEQSHNAFSSIPYLMSNLQQILSDVINLLYRVSSQTPKNSPSLAFLTFLVCDVTSCVGYLFCPSLVAVCHQHEEAEEEEDTTTTSTTAAAIASSSSRRRQKKVKTSVQKESIATRSLFFLSNRTIPIISNNTTSENRNNNDNNKKSNSNSKNKNQDDDVTSLCSKLDIALGCSIDCLFSDIESNIIVCFERFQDPLAIEKEQQFNDNVDDNKKQHTSILKCSQGLTQLLISLAEPLLKSLRLFSPGNLSQSKTILRSDARSVTHQLRSRILIHFVRCVVSYWLLVIEVVDEQKEQREKEKQQEEEEEEEDKFYNEKNAERAKKDLTVFFDFLLRHPDCREDVHVLSQLKSDFRF